MFLTKNNLTTLIDLMRKQYKYKDSLYKLGIELNLEDYDKLVDFLTYNCFPNRDIRDIFYYWLYDKNGIEKDPKGYLYTTDLLTKETVPLGTINQLYTYLKRLQNEVGIS